MNRVRVGVVVAAVVATGVMGLGGCPEDNPLLSITDEPNTAAQLTEADVFELLAVSAKADPPEADLETEDEQPYFGEQPALFEAVPVEAVKLPVEVLAQELDPNAVWPPGLHGKVAGRFISHCPNTDSHSDRCGGIFRGRWFDANGNVRGVVRGEYHPVPTDSLPEGIVGGGIFKGRILNLNGRLIGWLQGRYGHAENARGQFWGRWVGRHHQLIGLVKGHWDDDPDRPGGEFAGRWVALNICDEVASLPDYDFEEGDFGDVEPTDEKPQAALSVSLAGPSLAAEPSVFDEPDVRHWPVLPCIDPNYPWGFVRGWHVPYSPQPDSVDAERPRGGRFWGLGRNHHGKLLGYVVGHYKPLPVLTPAAELADVDPNAVRLLERPRILGVYYGKILTLEGKFRGYIRGVYGRSVHGMGVFRGNYFNTGGQELGNTFGRWSDHPFLPGGPWFGFWNGKGRADPSTDPDVSLVPAAVE